MPSFAAMSRLPAATASTWMPQSRPHEPCFIGTLARVPPSCARVGVPAGVGGAAMSGGPCGMFCMIGTSSGGGAVMISRSRV